MGEHASNKARKEITIIAVRTSECTYIELYVHGYVLIFESIKFRFGAR